MGAIPLFTSDFYGQWKANYVQPKNKHHSLLYCLIYGCPIHQRKIFFIRGI